MATLTEEAPNLDVNKVRIVFLDIDGVINSNKTWLLAGGWPGLNEDKEASTGYWGGPKAKVISKPYVTFPDAIDKYAVGLLNKLLVATNSHIVVSSTWREGLDVYQLRDVLEERGFDPKRIIGKTQDTGHSRGEQIFNYIQSLGEKRSYGGPDFAVQNGRLISSLSKVEMTLNSYVIVDDIPDFTDDQEKNHYVETNDDLGLTLKDTLRMGEILTGKYFGMNQLMHGEGYAGKILSVTPIQ